MRAALRNGIAAALAATVALGGVTPAHAFEAGVSAGAPVEEGALVDTDSDGLPDEWEENGVVLSDGTFLNLPAYGADPQRPDIFLQLNWMKSDEEDYGLEPGKIQDIVDLFDDHGIAMHIDAGETFNNIPGYEARGGETVEYSQYYFDGTTPAFQLLNNINDFLGPRQSVFRIGVIGDQIDENNLATGASLVNDNSFFVANHRFVNTQNKLRNAVLHELGHTLGLRHHGAHKAVRNVGETQPVNGEYHSVMNFLYQFTTFNYSEEPYEVQTAEGVETIPADWDSLVLNTSRIGVNGETATKQAQPTTITWTEKKPVEEAGEAPKVQEAPKAEAPQEPKPAPKAEADVNVAAIVAPIVAVAAIAGIGFALANMQGFAIPGLAL